MKRWGRFRGLPGGAGAEYDAVVEWISVPITKEWLSVGDIAGYLEVSDYVVATTLRRGEMPGLKVGREWRVAKADFEAWLNRRRGASP